jgi:hypothetical protein
MKSKIFIKDTGNIGGIISFTLPLIIFLLILNWFFKITPFQKFEGSPLIISPFIGIIGLGIGLKSLKKSSNKIAKLGVIGNISLLVLPFLYIFLGTLIGGV